MNKLQINSEAGVSGRYKFIRYDEKMNVKEETPWSDNIIVNQGLDAMMGGTVITSMNTYCQVGSGTTAPLPGNTALQALVASSVSIEEGIGVLQTATNPKYVKYQYRYRFAQGAAAGNLSEVAIRANQSPNPLISRALIKDISGNPTSVTVLSDEYLDVVWEFFFLPPTSSGSFNMFIDGVSTAFNFSMAPLKMNSASDWGVGVHSTSISNGGRVPVLIPEVNAAGKSLGKRDGASLAALTATTCAGTDTSPVGLFTTFVQSSYVAGSFTRNFTFKMPLNNGNHANGLNSFMFSLTVAHFQFLLTAPVLKVATKTFEITFTVTLANVAVPTN